MRRVDRDGGEDRKDIFFKIGAQPFLFRRLQFGGFDDFEPFVLEFALQPDPGALLVLQQGGSFALDLVEKLQDLCLNRHIEG